MACAISSEGGHDLVLSPLESRISSSQKGWERFQHELSREYPEYACSAPLVIERKRARWQITETVCVWVAFRGTMMPLCDTLKIIAPASLVPEGWPAPGLVYVPIERVLLQERIARRSTIKIDDLNFEYLRLDVHGPDDLADLLEIASPDYPERFGPGSIK